MANPSVSSVSLEANLHRQKDYEATYQSSGDPWGYSSYADVIRFRTIALAARHWFPNPNRSLDVACGLGQLTVLLNEFSQSVFAYDFAPSAVQRTRERSVKAQCRDVQVDVRDATDPGYEPDFFDLILMSDMDVAGNRDWWCHVLAIHREFLTEKGLMIACGRIRISERSQFDENFVNLGGKVIDRIYFHDRYWFKARSIVRRVMPPRVATRLLGQAWLFHSAETLGKVSGPAGSIHYGVVVRFA